jgi:hypothetical protein
MNVKSKLKRVLSVLVAAAAIYAVQHFTGALDGKSSDSTGTATGTAGGTLRAPAPAPRPTGASSSSTVADGAAEIRQASRAQRSGFMVSAPGIVEKTLPDDREGSPHQRFILRLSNGHTVLVAHNIHLASRVPLRECDQVEFHGQYEWNERGGVIHWTHHDPDGRHEEGWIRHNGITYE